MQFIDCTCKKCGASLELDIDDIKMFCPYCGNKLMLDISSEDLVEIIKDKGVTKRKELDIEEKKLEVESGKQDINGFLKLMIGIVFIGLGIMAFGGIMWIIGDALGL